MDEALKVLEARGDPTKNLHYRTRFALRLAALLGEPAQEVIAEASRIYTYLRHSPDEEFANGFLVTFEYIWDSYCYWEARYWREEKTASVGTIIVM